MVLTIVKFVVTLKFSFLVFLAWELKENWRLYKANQAKDVGQLPACGKRRGIYGSHLWWAYALIPASLRQMFWAHLKRNHWA